MDPPRLGSAHRILSALDTDEQVLRFVEAITSDVASIQSELLQQILADNADVAYFHRHGLFGVPSAEDFHSRLPLISYQDIELDVARIASGDEDGHAKILCARPVREVLKSSGTSGGRQKLFPKLSDYDPEFLVLNRVARPFNTGKSLHFIYVRNPEVTPGGVKLSSGLSGYFTSPAFRNRKIDPATSYTSPDQVLQCVDYIQANYCHLLCGLVQRDQVVSVGSVFASTFVRSLKSLKCQWRDICQDIAEGAVNSRIVTSLPVRNAVNAILRPDIELADAIRKECCGGNWRGIVRRLWPEARLVQTIITGTMQQYVSIIDMLTDGLPIASSLYASSECSSLGVNLDPVCPPSEVLYTLFPCFAYFEFLPLENRLSAPDEDQGQEERSFVSCDNLVKLADVKVGDEYELVLTTKAGLYRYRVGDILKVVKFHNDAPQFAFVRRAGVLLSVDMDKTDELELHKAVTQAWNRHQEHSEIRLVDYTSRVDLSSQPGHYIIYWEAFPDPQILELDVCCFELEESLSVVYRRNRREGSVGPLEIKLVRQGTFDKIMDHVVQNGGASYGQYKTPRCAKDPKVVSILESSVIAKGQARYMQTST
ncbi:hypothetical protein SELMODRAFT_131591 [Selaginella moellendorffii]|uniref:Uncharacterized protein DFL1L2-2 n=1 Tax=Selaginella moellendorffii TaxID=88036 RepID=D8T491_SELML|nr:hypothetical protein SELMODRAFT_131591 [Selaginella moellendorffii]